MRSLLWVIAATALGCSRAAASTPSPEDRSDASAGFAVVELFTSEGCSSCPPADEVFRQLSSDAARTGRRVYPVAFHVDYWDSLGWPDPYGTAAATRRQHDYARALGQQGVYTPEMIVNGRDGFVGSSRAEARRSIESALRGPEGAKIELAAKMVEERVAVDYALSDDPRGAVLRLALVQGAAETKVQAGENAGRTLRHAHVVRGFQTMPLGSTRRGHATFAAPPPTAGGAAIVAFLQDPVTMAIRGAARSEL